MDGFRARVTTTAQPVAQRDPGAFRSGTAEGLGAVGAAVARGAAQEAQLDVQIAEDDARIAQIEKARARSSVVADRMGAWPDVQVRVQNRLDDLKNSWKPAEGDYQAKADAVVTEELRAFTGSLGDDPEVVERFAPLIATFGASTRQGERRWALQSKAKAEGQGVDALALTLANGIVSDPTPAKFVEAMGSLDPLIDGLDAPEATRSAVKTQKKAAFARAFLDGRLALGDWQGVQAVLKTDQLDAYLAPEQKAQFIRQANNGQEAAAREVELAAGRVRDDARDAIKTIRAKIDAGIVPTATELAGVERQARAAKLDEADLVNFGSLSIQATVNRTYLGRPASAMRADLGRLQARIASGRASESDQVTAHQLEKLVDGADDREADTHRELLGQGVAGRLQVLASVQGTPDARYAVAEKVEKGLGALTGLGPRGQRAALQGRETRAARPKDFGDRAAVDGAAKAILGPLAGSLGGNYETVLNTAWDIMANGLAQNGGQGFNAETFRGALGTAMGATLRPGGAMQGGVQRVRGKPVWLPSWQTAPEFDAALSRTDFAGAVYANGKPADKADVLAHYRPTYVRDDDDGTPLYHLLDESGGALAGKDGSAFVLRPKKAR